MEELVCVGASGAGSVGLERGTWGDLTEKMGGVLQEIVPEGFTEGEVETEGLVPMVGDD